MSAQMEMKYASANEVEAAFADGRLRVMVDDPVPLASIRTMFVGGAEVWGKRGSARFVHVISGPARGEIRGYVLTEDGVLRLRYPNYPGDWPELDRAVLPRVGAKRVETNANAASEL